MRIEEISGKEKEKALELVLSVFMQYEAPDYSEQGIQSFKDFISNREKIDNLKFYSAYLDDALVGVIATRNNGNHIALFFVDGRHHRKGIGRKLFEQVVDGIRFTQMTYIKG